MKADFFGPRWLGEEFDDARSVGCEPLVVGEGEQYVGGFAPVGDVDRSIVGCGLCVAGVPVEFSAGELLRGHGVPPHRM